MQQRNDECSDICTIWIMAIFMAMCIILDAHANTWIVDQVCGSTYPKWLTVCTVIVLECLTFAIAWTPLRHVHAYCVVRSAIVKSEKRPPVPVVADVL